MKKYGFGVDVGGTTIKIGFFDAQGELQEKWEIDTRTEEDGKYILDDITEQIEKKLAQEGIDKKEVAGIGIGVPGPVKEDGTVIKCVNLGWGVFNVEQELAQKTNLIVKAGNDANLAALGEMWKGSGKGSEDILLVTLGTGVGGGIIAGGRILTGSNGAAAEIGHIYVNPNEKETCSCGKKGCLEQYASATGIVHMAQKTLQQEDWNTPLKNKKDLTAKDIFDAAKQGDEFACRQVDNLGEVLGTALANIACMVNPKMIVIGGGVSKAGQILIDILQKKFMEKSYHASQNAEIVLAALGNDAGIYGCIRMILE